MPGAMTGAHPREEHASNLRAKTRKAPSIAESREAAQAHLRNPAHDDVGKSSGCLSFARGDDANTVDKMQIEVRVRLQRLEMIIIFGRGCGCDRDIRRGSRP